ncbi:glycosyl transferase [Maritimibacter sp. 55A14]|uniref:ArnT family glycosyltransferase n=1 Tax=Maritimibacter sp. 55A14 TaxID=2174844 RepID=UPI000D61476F|nr:glycosyltransferase family 39 protein [Maritimibacter sp. 55A14]PWE32620.1 glycosyl transferase [Maritimibacter sp. 55A14]
MQSSAAHSDSATIRMAVIAVLAITALRVLALAFSRMDLFVDEAQYWLWGQELAIGYYSKPPMVGWVIRAFTELGGSDTAFWIRLPGPLFHATVALLLMAVAQRMHGAATGALVALAYLTLPMVSLGSLVISTDTILFPFLALALFYWLRLLDRPSAPDALLAGACLGLGFLSKYAAVYFLIGAALMALTRHDARPARRDAFLAALAFGLVILPNIAWNIANGGTTVSHTMDNASWVRDPATRAGLNLDKLAEFLAAQFIVFGPVLFGALIWAVARTLRGGAARAEAGLLWFVLPILAIVSVQAVLSKAYANWAATAYLAGALVAVPLLRARAPRWLTASFAINGALAVALPLAAVFADRLAWDGRLVMGRVIGRAEISETIIETARRTGAQTVVAAHRDILADLFHTGRQSGLTFRAIRGDGRPRHHYEMSLAYEGGAANPVLLAEIGEMPPACPHEMAHQWQAGPGAWNGYTITLWLVEPDCSDLGRF